MIIFRKIIAAVGLLLFLWLSLPPIVKVDPAGYAFYSLTKSDQYSDTQKKEMAARMEVGTRYYYDFVVPQYVNKILPAACFALLASILLFAEKKTEAPEANKTARDNARDVT